jgi:hypothetical protein
MAAAGISPNPTQVIHSLTLLHRGMLTCLCRVHVRTLSLPYLPGARTALRNLEERSRIDSLKEALDETFFQNIAPFWRPLLKPTQRLRARFS